MRKRSLLLLAVGVGLTLTWATAATTFQIVVVVLVLLVGFTGLSRVFWRVNRASSDVRVFVPFLAGSWLAIMMLTAHVFVNRRSDTATSEVGIEPIIELVYFTLSAALSIIVIRRVQSDMASARPPMSLFLLPIVVIASGFWGMLGPYSIVRGYQFFVIALLAWATACVGEFRSEYLDDLASMFVRWFIVITGCLVLLGVALGPLRVPTGPSNAGRFTWFAAHPNGAGLLIATATVLLAAAPRRVINLPVVVRAAGVVGLIVAMYFNHSRTSWVCLLIGLAFVYLTAGRVRPRILGITGPFLALGLTIVSIFHWDRVWSYVLRDQSTEAITTGNGRIELWGIGFRSLDTAFEWLFGLGYGVTRFIFLEEAAFASNAHNSLLAMLMNIGVIGSLIFMGTIAMVVYQAIRSRVVFEYDLGRAIGAAVLLMILNGVASDIMAEPTLGFGLLYFGAVMTRWYSHTRSDHHLQQSGQIPAVSTRTDAQGDVRTDGKSVQFG